MKKLGFYGGSFDPIHFGHINLALEISEKHGLDKVLFCPANISPFKKINFEPLPVYHRVLMTELAIEDINSFEVIDLEAKREEISYTVDTLRELKGIYPEHEIFLILGMDMVHNFSKWKNPEEILSLAKPLVGMRNNEELDPGIDYCSFFEKGLTKTRTLDISSTEIRQRIQLKNYIRHLVPSKVVDYIYENKLY